MLSILSNLKRHFTVFESIIAGAIITLLYCSSLIAANNDVTSLAGINHLIIDNIICENNKNTQCSYITNKYYQEIGDILNPEKIEEAKLRLSTLNQFRKITVRLKKGQIKGHVVVVFNVHESDSVQYEFASFYTSDNAFTSTALLAAHNLTAPSEQLNLLTYGYFREVVNFEARITNYNFLGTGKQFSLLLIDRSSDITNLDRDLNHYSENSFSDDIFNYAGLTSSKIYFDYFDPHFMDAKNYFISAQLGYSSKKQSLSYYELDNEQNQQQSSSTSSTSSFLGASIGMRFAEYSYVSMSANQSEENDKLLYQISYGWNSQNDPLFPTQGSFLKIYYSAGEKQIDSELIVEFQKNHQFSNKTVLSFGIGDKFSDSKAHQIGTNETPYRDSNPNKNIYFKLSGMIFSNKNMGDYSGWSAGYTIDLDVSNSLFANYIYHTDKLIFNLGITYYPDEG